MFRKNDEIYLNCYDYLRDVNNIDKDLYDFDMLTGMSQDHINRLVRLIKAVKADMPQLLQQARSGDAVAARIFLRIRASGNNDSPQAFMNEMISIGMDIFLDKFKKSFYLPAVVSCIDQDIMANKVNNLGQERPGLR